MIENRRLAKSGQFVYRLYKASSEDEAFAQVEQISKHYHRSVRIEKWGNVVEKDIISFQNMCDDLAYLDLKLKVGDSFILVKEITSLKLEDDKKIIRSKNHHKILPKSSKWTDEQLKHLWRGLPDIVAKIVNKTVDEVEKERKNYIKNNPGFEYPKECKPPRKNAKVVVEKKPWAQSELDVLWDFAPKQMSLLLKRTVFEIADKRREVCLQNPNFIIPASAKFNKLDLPNKYEEVTKFSEKLLQNVEIQNSDLQNEKNGGRIPGFWSDPKNIHILWNNDVDEICKLLDKTPKAVYQQRLVFLSKNPGFVIPKASGFVLKKQTGYDFSYEGEEIKKEQPTVTVTPHTQEERRVEPIPQVIETQQQSQTTQPQEVNTIQNIANLLNQLSVKPKKITVGDITLEF